MLTNVTQNNTYVNMKRDEVLNVRVPSEVKTALKKAADADDRSVSTMAVRILREWLTGHDFLLSGTRKGGVKRRWTNR